MEDEGLDIVIKNDSSGVNCSAKTGLQVKRVGAPVLHTVDL